MEHEGTFMFQGTTLLCYGTDSPSPSPFTFKTGINWFQKGAAYAAPKVRPCVYSMGDSITSNIRQTTKDAMPANPNVDIESLGINGTSAINTRPLNKKYFVKVISVSRRGAAHAVTCMRTRPVIKF
jgi:hypothetical protein